MAATPASPLPVGRNAGRLRVSANVRPRFPRPRDDPRQSQHEPASDVWLRGLSDPQCLHERPNTFSAPTWQVENYEASRQHLDHYQPSVLVWFHGGGLSTGQGILYGPHFFIETEIIVITVNYRLGPWGSLSLDTPTISGNQVGNNQAQFPFRTIGLFPAGLEGSSNGTAVD